MRVTYWLDYGVREGTWNVPKSMWRRYFARDGICINFWNAPKLNGLSFSLFSVRKLIPCLIFEIPNFYKLHFRINIGSNASNVQNISSTYFLRHFKCPPVRHSTRDFTLISISKSKFDFHLRTLLYPKIFNLWAYRLFLYFGTVYFRILRPLTSSLLSCSVSSL